MKRLVYITTFFFAALTIALVITLRSDYFTEALIDYATPILERELNSEIKIKGLELPIFTTHFQITGLEFSPRPIDRFDPLAKIERLEADIDLLRLFAGEIEIKNIKIDGLRFNLILDTDTEDTVLNLPMLEPATSPTSSTRSTAPPVKKEPAAKPEGEVAPKPLEDFILRLGEARITNSIFYLEIINIDMQLMVTEVEVNADLSDLIEKLEIRYTLNNSRADYRIGSLNFKADRVSAAGRVNIAEQLVEWHDANVEIDPLAPGRPKSRIYVTGHVIHLLEDWGPIVEIECEEILDSKIVNESISEIPSFDGMVDAITRIYVHTGEDVVSIGGPAYARSLKLWNFDLTDLAVSSYKVSTDALETSGISFKSCGGEVVGWYDLKINDTFDFQSELQAAGLDLACIYKAVGHGTPFMSGRIGQAPNRPVDIRVDGGLTPFHVEGYLDMFSPDPVTLRLLGDRPAESELFNTFDFDFLHVRSAFKVDLDRVAFAPFDFTAPRQKLSAVGSIDYESGFALSFRSVFDDLSQLTPLTGILLKGGGLIEGNLHGAFDNPTISTYLDLEPFQIDHFYFSGLKGSVELENKVFRTEGITLKNIYSEIDLSGEVSIADPPIIDIEVDINDTRLAELFVAYNPDDEFFASSRGLLNANINLYGPLDRLTGQVDAEMSNARFFDEDISLIELEADLDKGNIDLNRLVLSLPSGGVITGGGKYSPDSGMNFVVQTIGLESSQITNLTKKLPDISGPLSLSARISGMPEQPKIAAEARISDLVLYGRHWRDLDAFLTLNDDTVYYAATAEGGNIYIAGESETSGKMPYNLYADILDLDLGQLMEKALEVSPLTGSLRGRLTMAGNLINWEDSKGQLQIDDISLSHKKYNFANRNPLIIDYAYRRFEINPVEIEGNAMNWKVYEGYIEYDGAAKVNFEGWVNLSLLEMAFDSVARADGLISFTRGSVERIGKDFALSGLLDLKNAQLGFKSIGESLEIKDMAVSITRGNGSIDRFIGGLGGGKVNGGGFFVLDGFKPVGIQLNAELENTNLRTPSVFPTKINGKVTLSGPPQSLLLAGDINVLKGVYSEEVDWQSNIFRLTGRRKSITEGGGPPPPLSYNLNIASKGGVLIDNNLVNTKLDAHLKLIGPYNRPALLGRLEMIGEEKEIYLFGSTLKVENGFVRFIDETAIEPELDILATTKIVASEDVAEDPEDVEYKITVEINGTAEESELKINYFSEPSLPSEDILCLLAAGSICKQAGLLAGLQLAPGLGNVSQDVSALLGIDRFRIEPSYSRRSGTTEPFITIGKDISDQFEIKYSTAISGAGDQRLLLEYKLTRNFSLQASWDNQTENAEGNIGADMKFRFRFR